MKRNEESILEMYLGEIGRYPLLTRDEERRLGERAASGDREARHALVRANLRFVVTVARRYQHNGVPLLDLISEGNLGLMRAAECYDVSRGHPFLSYAAWWVRQSILKAISDKSRLIRLPWNRANELVRLDRERSQLQNERPGCAGTAELARRLSVDESHLRNLMNCARPPLSLDIPAGEAGGGSPLRELVPDPSRRDPAETLVQRSLEDNVAELLRTLTDKEAEILRHRFGLDGRQRLSLQELGRLYRLSKERVRQIEKRALDKLRCSPRRRLVESYVA